MTTTITGLTSQQRAAFDRDGFVIVPGVLDPATELDPVMTEYAAVLDGLAGELSADGIIPDPYSGLDFSDRLTRVCREAGQVFPQHFDMCLPQRGITASTPIWTGPAVFGLLRSARVLDAVESLIGGEIYSNPVQHVRLKPPERDLPAAAAQESVLGTTPWHQDVGVITEDADGTEMITVWAPLTDCDVADGCLAVVPGSHQGTVLTHCPGAAGLGLPSGSVDPRSAVPLPMSRGSALFMHRRTVHGSLPNVSHRVRCSFDLRYSPIGQPTGRSAFPGFVARSRLRPEQELTDPARWSQSWQETRRVLAAHEPAAFNRWRSDAPACA